MLHWAGWRQNDPGLLLLSLILEPTSLGFSHANFYLFLSSRWDSLLARAHSILIHRLETQNPKDREIMRSSDAKQEWARFSDVFPVGSGTHWPPLYFHSLSHFPKSFNSLIFLRFGGEVWEKSSLNQFILLVLMRTATEWKCQSMETQHQEGVSQCLCTKVSMAFSWKLQFSTAVRCNWNICLKRI